MPQTLQNGIRVPINSDAYNLVPDLTTMAGDANTPIPVSTITARDALTKYPGLTVIRLDMPGIPTQIWNGTSWAHQGRNKKTLFNNTGLTNVTGTGSRLLADLNLNAANYDRIMVANAQLAISSDAITSGVYQIYGAVSLMQASVTGAQGKGPLSWGVPGNYRQAVTITTGEILVPANATPSPRMWMETISGSVSTTVDDNAAVTKFWTEEYPA